MGNRIRLALLATVLGLPSPGLAGHITIVEGSAGFVGPQIQALSGDGAQAAGSDLFQMGFRFGGSGLAPLPVLPGGGPLRPTDASLDGAVVVGQARPGVAWEAFRSVGGVTTSLGTMDGWPASVAHAVNGDGSVVVGESGTAFRWTQATGMLPLSGAIGQGAVAYGVSGDGDVIAGIAYNLPGNEAFRWTEATGMVSLGTLPGHEESTAWAVSEDGTTVVGTSFDSDTLTGEAFRWTQALGMQGLGRLPGTTTASGTDVSGDGSVVVGDSWGTDGEGTPFREPFVWTEPLGMLPLAAYLATQGVPSAVLSKPVLTAVSDDGRVLAGYDEDTAHIRSFVIDLDAAAQVPALPPAAAWVLGICLVASVGRWLASPAAPTRR